MFLDWDKIEAIKKGMELDIEKAKKKSVEMVGINCDALIKSLDLDGNYTIKISINATDKEKYQSIYKFDNYLLEKKSLLGT